MVSTRNKTTNNKQKSTAKQIAKKDKSFQIRVKIKKVQKWMELRSSIESASEEQKPQLKQKLTTFLLTLNTEPHSATRKLRKWKQRIELFENAPNKDHNRLPSNSNTKPNPTNPPAGVRVLSPIPLNGDTKQAFNKFVQLLQHEKTLNSDVAVDINNATKISIYNITDNDKHADRNYKALVKHLVANKITNRQHVKQLPSFDTILQLSRDTLHSDATLSSMTIETLDLLVYDPKHQEHNFPQPIHSDTPATSNTEFGDKMQFSIMLTDGSKHTTFYNTDHVPKITSPEWFAEKYELPPSILSRNKKVQQHIRQWGRLLGATPEYRVTKPAEQFSSVAMDGGVPHCSPGANNKFRVVLFGTATKVVSTSPSMVYDDDQMSIERFWLIIIECLTKKLRSKEEHKKILQKLYETFAMAIVNSASQGAFDATLLTPNNPDASKYTLRNPYFKAVVKQLADKALQAYDNPNNTQLKKERDEMVTLVKYFDVHFTRKFPPTPDTNGKRKRREPKQQGKTKKVKAN